MSRAVLLVLLLLLIPVTWAVRWTSEAFEVVTGYSAKQLCSGVFVAWLEPDFVIENDIHLSMGVLGPLLSQLHLEVDRQQFRTKASLLGVEAHAVRAEDGGCVLNPVSPVVTPDPNALSWAGLAGPLEVEATPALQAVVDAAFEEPAAGQRRTLAVVVLHGDELVAQRFAEGISQFTSLQGWSMNKSLMSTWVGMQVARGELNLETPLAPLIARKNPDLVESVDPSLNLGHLLHMESGLDFEETYFPGDDATRMLYRSSAMWTVAPGNGHRYPPGEFFSYSSGDTNLASWVWQQSLDRPYNEWLQEHFANQLALFGLTSEHDASGVQVGSSYTYMRAQEWARVGRFWLRAWHDGSELLPDNWMREATTPRPSARDGQYGRGFWLNAQGRDFPELPRNMFYASGHNGQFVVMFPDEDVVVVRLGLSSSFAATGLNELLKGVLATLPAPDPLAAAQPSGQ